jgi:CheY-like chemotaxis protein
VSTTRKYYKKIFIIDDDVEDQEIFMEALKEVDSSIACLTSNSGDDALQQLSGSLNHLPDLIFLDLNLPKLNGKQILREIKKNDVINRIPVIMFSTSFAPRDIDEVKKSGAVFHLLKPARFHDLCKSLKTILSTDWHTSDMN